MPQYEATFEIESRKDTHVVRLLTEQVYDTLREELREVYREDSPPTGTIQVLATIREAAKRPSPGSLTITYEQRAESFGE